MTTPTSLRWGILGTGYIARAFTNDLNLNGFTITAVGSRSQTTADAFATEFNIETAHGSYEALATDPNVDAIYIATPHPFHADNALLSLDNGKHVLIEKPFTVNALEAQRVIDRAAEKGLVALEAMWTRYLPHMVRIRELIASGALGEVRSVVADHMQLLPDDPAHRINALELGGGALLDLGIYPVSFTFDVLGKPEKVQATATFRETGADVQVATMFTYPSGAVATTVSMADAAGPNVASVVGTAARLEIDRTWYMPTSFRLISSRGDVLETFSAEINGRGMHYQALEVERLAASGAVSGEILPTAEIVAIMQTMDSIREQIGLRYPSEDGQRS